MQEIQDRAASEVRRGAFHEILVRTTPRLWVTPALIAANAAYFLLGIAKGASLEPEQRMIDLGANFGPLIFQGEWWRLASSMFVHGGFLHLLLNLWCLWVLGNLAERMFGNVSFSIVYLASGIGGSLASLLWHPYIVSVGASGAIFGLAGGLLAFLYFGEVLVPRPIVRELLASLAIFVGFNLLFGSVWPGIDNAAHLGGLLTGLALGTVLHRPLPFGRPPLRRLATLPVLLLLFVAAARFARENRADDPEVLAAWALQLETDGKREEAIAELERALDIDPEIEEGFAKLGLLYLAAERFDEAANAFERAVSRSPDSAPVRSALGYAYLRGGRYSEAVSTFQKATELDPQLYEPQRNLAIALRFAGRLEEAGEAFRIARQMEPSDISLYVDSSALFVETNELDEALAILEEARTWNPESAGVESQMGLVRLRRGETELAVQALEKAAELEPGEAEHHNRLALARAKAGRGDDAIEAIEKALELRPGEHHLLDTLGTVRLARGEIPEAIEAYRKAMALAPEQAIYHYNLSLALERRGESLAAKAEREEAFRINPDLSPPPDGSPII